MVKARELRIGNLLDYKGQTVHVTSLSLDIDDEYEPNVGFCRHGEDVNEQIEPESSFGVD